MQLAYDENGYIDWPLILSKDAPYNLIIDARTRGKTFGLRYQCALRDYPKRHKRFVELVRTKEQLKGSDALQVGYYDKMRSALPDDALLSRYVLDTQGRLARIAHKPDEGKKPKWDTLGYFLALSDAGTIKNRSNSFADVRRFIFDEALLDRRIDKIHNYLPNEIESVASIMTSVSRENRNTPDADRPRLYLLGNAVDLTCPWLAHFGITDVPPYGFSWHFGGKCLATTSTSFRRLTNPSLVRCPRALRSRLESPTRALPMACGSMRGKAITMWWTACQRAPATGPSMRSRHPTQSLTTSWQGGRKSP